MEFIMYIKIYVLDQIDFSMKLLLYHLQWIDNIERLIKCLILEHQKEYFKQRIKALDIPITQQYEIIPHKKCIVVIKLGNALE